MTVSGNETTLLSMPLMIDNTRKTQCHIFLLVTRGEKQTDLIIGWKVDTGKWMIYWSWQLIASCGCMVTDIQIHKDSPFVLVSLNFICIIIAGL